MSYYTIERLEELFREENMNWSIEEVEYRAKDLHKHLNTLDTRWRRSNRRFYSQVELYG